MHVNLNSKFRTLGKELSILCVLVMLANRVIYSEKEQIFNLSILFSYNI